MTMNNGVSVIAINLVEHLVTITECNVVGFKEKSTASEMVMRNETGNTDRAFKMQQTRVE